MLFSTTIVFTLLSFAIASPGMGHLEARAACNRDNCFRALLGKAATATTDCVLFATDAVVPTYASACSGTARYSSACSCLTSAPSTPSSTSTSTSTTTTTPTPTPTPTYTYNQFFSGDRCVYNHYNRYDVLGTYDYGAAVAECQRRCSSYSDCSFVFVESDDPTAAKASGSGCI